MGLLITLSRLLERRLGNAGLVVVAVVILFLSITGAVSQSDANRSASGPASTVTSGVKASTSTTARLTTSTTVGARNGLDGYSAVSFTVTPAGDTGKKFCGLLAASPSQQATGLMNRSDLGGYDGMLFPFGNDTTASFYMANVPVALSVAWFDKDGKFVSSADMDPCKTTAANCPLYSASSPYRLAIETLKGGLGSLGITSGSTISVGSAGPC
jgi:uncharacterized protein